MEVKINKEIRNYTESIFFGLSFRQFFFSLCACITAVILYFLAIKYFNKEITSWICIIGVLPFIGLGFFKYNGMNLEQFIKEFIISMILTPKELKYKSKNIYYEAIQNEVKNKEKEKINK